MPFIMHRPGYIITYVNMGGIWDNLINMTTIFHHSLASQMHMYMVYVEAREGEVACSAIYINGPAVLW